jgi:hypothetical protein
MLAGPLLEFYKHVSAPVAKLQQAVADAAAGEGGALWWQWWCWTGARGHLRALDIPQPVVYPMALFVDTGIEVDEPGAAAQDALSKGAR